MTELGKCPKEATVTTLHSKEEQERRQAHQKTAKTK
jgi:hypothetical protein